jgi:hypothetical protein
VPAFLLFKRVKALHQTEKRARLKTEQDHAEAKKAEVGEWRKFRWGIIATFVTMMIDLVVHYAKLFSVK